MAWGSTRWFGTASRQVVGIGLPPHRGEVGVHSQLLNGTLDGAAAGGRERDDDGPRPFGNLKCHGLRALDRSYFFRLQVRQDGGGDVLVQTDLRQRSSWILVPHNERDLGTEACEDLRELDGHDARPGDGDAFREVGQRVYAIRFEYADSIKRNARDAERPRPGAQQDVVRRELPLIIDAARLAAVR